MHTVITAGKLQCSQSGHHQGLAVSLVLLGTKFHDTPHLKIKGKF